MSNLVSASTIARQASSHSMVRFSLIVLLGVTLGASLSPPVSSWLNTIDTEASVLLYGACFMVIGFAVAILSLGFTEHLFADARGGIRCDRLTQVEIVRTLFCIAGAIIAGIGLGVFYQTLGLPT